MTQVFEPGDRVKLFYGFADRSGSGIYEVVRALPTSVQDERQYQVRGPEGYDRVISEGQIRLRLEDAEEIGRRKTVVTRAQLILSPSGRSRAVSLAHHA